MNINPFPVIDPVATGENIVKLRRERGLSVRDLQAFFGFEEPQAIYKWQRGKTLPSVDNLYALGKLLEVPMDEILISENKAGRQSDDCGPVIFVRLFWTRRKPVSVSTNNRLSARRQKTLS